MEIITPEDLQKFRTQLFEDIKQFLQQPRQQARPWLKSVEVRKMLGISPGTLLNLRVNGTLPFTKIGGLVFYKYEDIVKLLEGSGKDQLLKHG